MSHVLKNVLTFGQLWGQIVGCIERLTRSPSAMLTTLLLAFVLLIDDLIMFIE